MRKLKNRFERSRQILAWLKHEWPCGRPVELRWVKEIAEDGEQYCAETTRTTGSRVLLITLSKRKCRAWDATAETLIHEYAHILTWGPASLEHHTRCDDHPVWFYACEGELLNVWNHHHGWEHSKEFPFQ